MAARVVDDDLGVVAYPHGADRRLDLLAAPVLKREGVVVVDEEVDAAAVGDGLAVGRRLRLGERRADGPGDVPRDELAGGARVDEDEPGLAQAGGEVIDRDERLVEPRRQLGGVGGVAVGAGRVTGGQEQQGDDERGRKDLELHGASSPSMSQLPCQ